VLEYWRTGVLDSTIKRFRGSFCFDFCITPLLPGPDPPATRLLDGGQGWRAGMAGRPDLHSIFILDFA